MLGRFLFVTTGDRSMPWLIETLRVIREVRDLADYGFRRSPGRRPIQNDQNDQNDQKDDGASTSSESEGHTLTPNQGSDGATARMHAIPPRPRPEGGGARSRGGAKGSASRRSTASGLVSSDGSTSSGSTLGGASDSNGVSGSNGGSSAGLAGERSVGAGMSRRNSPASRRASVARSRRGGGVDLASLPVPDSPAIPLELIDPQALQAVRRLRSAGFKAYLVGGCVRDLLLELTPKDFDIATDANPEEIRRIFRNSRIIGRRFRLVHLYFRDGKIIEVSTFRAMTQHEDGSSEEGADLLIRRDNVFGTEEEDARRRDFTINGLFFDVVSGQIIDHVGGLEDLKTRCLRMIGDPEIRLREDPVRILRAIRFVAKTSLHLDPDLAAAMVRHKDEISRCSPPRILEETLRLLRIGHSEKTVSLLEETGLLGVLLPELKTYLDPTDASAEARHIRLYAYLHALDDMVRREPVSDTVALAALMAAPIEDLEGDGIGGDAGAPAGGSPAPGKNGAAAAGRASNLASRQRLVTDFIITIGQRISLTRKLTEQLRQVFMAQKFFGDDRTGSGGAAGSGARRRSRATPATLMKRGFFQDALKFYEVRVHALDWPEDDLDAWKARVLKAERSLTAAAEDEVVAAPAARRRAPRRPRRRR